MPDPAQDGRSIDLCQFNCTQQGRDPDSMIMTEGFRNFVSQIVEYASQSAGGVQRAELGEVALRIEKVRHQSIFFIRFEKNGEGPLPVRLKTCLGKELEAGNSPHHPPGTYAIRGDCVGALQGLHQMMETHVPEELEALEAGKLFLNFHPSH